jgi:hypothetical protein
MHGPNMNVNIGKVCLSGICKAYMIFLIETSRTPIYDRIAIAFCNALIKLGHTSHFYDPDGFDENSFISTINSINIDYYFSTNVFNKIHQLNGKTQRYNFEDINHKMIFIHHDSAFCPTNSIENIDSKLGALIKHQNKISHFFIEISNLREFKALGISNCYNLSHASEFISKENILDYSHDLAFVGHTMSNLNGYPMNRDDFGHHLVGLAWKRYSKSTHHIQPEIDSLSKDPYLLNKLNCASTYDLSRHRYLMQLLTQYTMAYRGEVISNIKNHTVNIYGGDLSYGKIDNPILKINKENVIYQPATSNYQDTSEIYRKSKINLNISSLQFDTAMNNRIIDIVLAGGFVLTDRRDDLLTASSVGRDISFETPEEMQYKIDYFLSEKNIDEYINVKNTILKEFKDKYTYFSICEKIIKDLVKL